MNNDLFLNRRWWCLPLKNYDSSTISRVLWSSILLYVIIILLFFFGNFPNFFSPRVEIPKSEISIKRKKGGYSIFMIPRPTAFIQIIPILTFNYARDIKDGMKVEILRRVCVVYDRRVSICISWKTRRYHQLLMMWHFLPAQRLLVYHFYKKNRLITFK